MHYSTNLVPLVRWLPRRTLSWKALSFELRADRSTWEKLLGFFPKESGQRHRRPTFSLEVESNEDTIAEVRVAQSEEVEAKAARNFHR